MASDDALNDRVPTDLLYLWRRGKRGGHMKRRAALTAIAGLAVVGLIGGVGSVASATTPGHNGRIVFAADDGDGFELFTIRADGTGLVQLTHLDGDATHPDWSPNGRRITFQLEDPTHAGVVIMKRDGSDMHELTSTGFEAQPAFTPDGHHVVFDCECERQGIFIMRDDGSYRRRLTTHAFAYEPDTDPNVSPDNDTVTFVRHKVGGVLQALFAVDRNGGNVRRLVPYGLEVAVKHDWAPNGRHIVITTNADYPDGRSPNVATVAADGSGLRMLTTIDRAEVGAYAGSFSPNGRWIVFRVENLVTERFRLFKMRPDGSHRTLIADLPFAPRHIDWGPLPS
jgi:Tol biopolymer transport system component